MHIHLDAVGGMAGDMFVGAMLDAMPELTDRVSADLAAVLPAAAGVPRLAKVSVNGLQATHFSLEPLALAAKPPEPEATYAALTGRIAATHLSEGTAAVAQAILTRLAQREADIHGVSLPDVHFHEIGDWDSLADVVAAGSIIAAVGVATWSVSPLPLGGGQVKTAHGMLPVPAPATLALLKGFVWHDDGISGERVTPTGGAILAQLDAASHARPTGRLLSSGSGAGTRRYPNLPNIVRVSCFDVTEALPTDRISVISFDIDDMTGEEIGTAIARLRALPGVLDLSTATRRGKKDRPLEEFRLLVVLSETDAVIRHCFVETSTLGLRVEQQQRIVLPRHVDHAANVKNATRPDGSVTTKLENDVLTSDSLAERRRQRQKAESQ